MTDHRDDPFGPVGFYLPGMESMPPGQRELLTQRIEAVVKEMMPAQLLRIRNHQTMMVLLQQLHLVAEKVVLDGYNQETELDELAEQTLAAMPHWNSNGVMVASQMIRVWQAALQVFEGMLDVRFAELATEAVTDVPETEPNGQVDDVDPFPNE
jgi:hypothetical protein